MIAARVTASVQLGVVVLLLFISNAQAQITCAAGTGLLNSYMTRTTGNVFGNAGGNRASSSGGFTTSGSGGGGATQQGQSNWNECGGKGGEGYTSFITKNPTVYGSGGAGGCKNSGCGVSLGGTNAGNALCPGKGGDAVANRGGAGGGGGWGVFYSNIPGGLGGSGIVVVAYAVNDTLSIQATGGSETLVDGYWKVHEFLSVGASSSLSVTKEGYCEILIVGGGGNGNMNFDNGAPAGGGGGGQVIALQYYGLDRKSYPVIVGDRQAQSSFGSIIATRGGLGGRGSVRGQSGGSGGGAPSGFEDSIIGGPALQPSMNLIPGMNLSYVSDQFGYSAVPACKSCVAGEYSRDSICTPCEAGKYLSTTGATAASSCVDCGANTYSATVGATAVSTCLACTSNSQSLSGSSTCICKLGLFTLKSIRQKNPMPNVDNTFTVSLTADCNIPLGSTVTIRGLTNQQTEDSASLAVTSTGNLLGTSGVWTQSTGTGILVLTVQGSGLASGQPYSVTFVLRNVDISFANSLATDVSATIVDGSGASQGSIARVALTKPSLSLYGVSWGTDPGRILRPSISRKIIQQSTPGSGVTNKIVLSLAINYNLATGSTVTVTGLTGSQTADSASLAVTSTGNRLGTSGAWTRTSGTLVLTAASGGMEVGNDYEVTFVLTNPLSAQASPAVSVSAEVQDGSGYVVGPIASVALAKSTGTLYGVSLGSEPLKVVVPSFSLKYIQQSTSTPGATNTLTVSLTADFQLPAGSTVTITGLTGSQTANSASLAVTSTSSLLGTTGAWTQSTGQLVLTSKSAGVNSGIACVVTFVLTNVATEQASPTVSVSAAIYDTISDPGVSVGSIASVTMTKPGTELDPLLLVFPPKCEAGSTGPDIQSCQLCAAGKYKTAPGSAACIDCGAGKYSATLGESACLDCVAGKYSTTSGASVADVCLGCTAGRRSPPGSDAIADCSCNTGYIERPDGECAWIWSKTEGFGAQAQTAGAPRSAPRWSRLVSLSCLSLFSTFSDK